MEKHLKTGLQEPRSLNHTHSADVKQQSNTLVAVQNSDVQSNFLADFCFGD